MWWQIFLGIVFYILSVVYMQWSQLGVIRHQRLEEKSTLKYWWYNLLNAFSLGLYGFIFEATTGKRKLNDLWVDRKRPTTA